jgi:hypothetical protein
MKRAKTGICESCKKRTETEIVTDDWTTRLEEYELCYECRKDD